MDQLEKVRENRARNAIRRRGLQLRKSRSRDCHALDFGMYQIVDPNRNLIIVGGGYRGFGMTLEDVEAWLAG